MFLKLLALVGALALTAPALALGQTPTTIDLAGVAANAGDGANFAELYVAGSALPKAGELTPIASSPIGADGAYKLTAEAPPAVLEQLGKNGAANLLILIRTPRAIVPRFTTWKPGNVLDLGPPSGPSIMARSAGTMRGPLDVDAAPTNKSAMKVKTGTARAAQIGAGCATSRASEVKGKFTPVAENFMYQDLTAQFSYSNGAEVDVEVGGSASGSAGSVDFSRVEGKASSNGTTRGLRANEGRVWEAAFDYKRAYLACAGYVGEPYVTGATWTGALRKAKVLRPSPVCGFRKEAQRIALGPGDTHRRDTSKSKTFGNGVSVAGIKLDVRSRYSSAMQTVWTAGKQKRLHLLCGQYVDDNPAQATRLVAGPNLKPKR